MEKKATMTKKKEKKLSQCRRNVRQMRKKAKQ